MKQIYLAGPDVFLPNAVGHFDRLCERCAALGLRGVRPSDGGMSAMPGADPAVLACRIYRANLDLISTCDALIANLEPFRNPLEPDSGTVFELGYAVALGKPVSGFLSDAGRPHEDKVSEHCGTTMDAAGLVRDATHGFLVESFGQPLNLMLACSTRLFADFDSALRDLAQRLARPARIP
jgi:nucleoside 2-deoxyribosyltransferase